MAAALLRLEFGERLDRDHHSVEASAFALRVTETIPGAEAKLFGDSSGHWRVNQVTEEALQHLELNGLVMRQYFHTENVHLSLAA